MKRMRMLVFAMLALGLLGMTASSMAESMEPTKPPIRSLIAYPSDYGACLAQAAQEAALPQVRVTVGENSYTLTLYDTPPSRELLEMLPVTLSFGDYAGSEKIAYLPQNLTIPSEQEPYEAAEGDLTVYTPWGNLAFFYHDFTHSASLYRLGHMEDIDAFAQNGESFTATFEILE